MCLVPLRVVLCVYKEIIMNIWGVILAAGSGQRLQEAGLSSAKQFLSYKGKPLFWHGAHSLAKVPEVRGLVFVFPAPMTPEEHTQYEKQIHELFFQDNITLDWRVVAGGSTRQESVVASLGALPSSCEAVLIHDSARPFGSPKLMARVAEALQRHTAVIPALAVTDTIKYIDNDGFVGKTLDRARLRSVQTPQGFHLQLLKKAHHKGQIDGVAATDDAMLMEHSGERVYVVEGEAGNIKITHPEDLALLEEKDTMGMMLPLTGFGYDVHQYGGDRQFILGGVPIQTDITLKAHSDGDVLLHALCDAILGCLGGKVGDIGTLFPDNDPQYENYASGALLSDVLHMALREKVRIVHVDMTVIAQVPKVSPHRYSIAKNVASLLQLPIERVSVKATTEEKMGFTGEKKGIKAVVVVSAVRYGEV